MEPRRDAGRRADGPNQQPTAQRTGRLPILGRSRPRYENPSLEQYSDLRFEKTHRRRRPWLWVLGGALLLVPLTVLGFMIAIYWQARHDEVRHVDAIVVMGAAQWNGRPSPVLAARLEHALQLYEDGYAPTIIVTGGKQPGDQFTEGGTSEAWLLQRNVPQSAILVEDQGNSTWGSMQGVGELARANNIQSVLIVSDGFHLFRSERMADAVGLTACSSAAPDKEIRAWSAEEFAYVVRETGATILQIPDWLF